MKHAAKPVTKRATSQTTEKPTGRAALPQAQPFDDPWMTQETRDLAAALMRLESDEEALRFLRDLCTVREIQELGQRWHVARMLAQGTGYQQISEQTGASSATVSRVNQWLRYGRSGYQALIDRLDDR